MKKTPRPRTVLPPDRRRQLLLDAATAVFARKGYRTATISDVIAHARVARGTFYLYFDSKEAVFLAIVEAFHQRVREALGAMDAGPAAAPADPRAVLRTGFERWLRFFAAHRDAAAVILREASSIDPRFEKGYAGLRRTALTHFASRYRRLQALGIIRSTVDPDLLAHLQLGMFDELLAAFILPGGPADLAALADQLADFEWNGVRPDRE